MWKKKNKKLLTLKQKNDLISITGILFPFQMKEANKFK